MRIFDNRKVSVREFKQQYDRGELDLTPRFQRRSVWTDKARSYLIDTILRGKPIPIIYLREKEKPNGDIVREVVDGQQRLTSVLEYLNDAFPINAAQNEEFGGMRFSELDADTQHEIRYYEFSVDILLDAPDQEIYDIFARLNKYPVKINDQELRNSQYFGEFKSVTYKLANEFTTFWLRNGIFSDKQISRMVEAEFTAELLIVECEGIKAKSKKIIDDSFKRYDDKFANRSVLMRRFRETMDIIGAIWQESLSETSFRRDPLLYSLFCAVYHLQYGVPGLDLKRVSIKRSDVAKIRSALVRVDEIFEVPPQEVEKLPPREREFRLATEIHTIHAANRQKRAAFLIESIRSAIDK